jgi:toxin ParE1/3/4
MTVHHVQITAEAEGDLFDIGSYIARNDSPERAVGLLDELERACLALATHPGRGHSPPEMSRIGIDLYRETHFQVYRIIYEISGKTVFVYAVVDGRRDLQSLLERRLLRPKNTGTGGSD